MKKIILLMCLSFSVFVNAEVGNSEIPLDDFLSPSEFKNMIISPNGKRIAAIHEGDIRDLVTILDMESMKTLSTFEFGENRKVGNLSWASNDFVVMNIRKFVGNLDRKGQFDGVYLAKFNGKMRDYIFRGDPTSGKSVATLRDSLPDEPKYILVNSFPGGGIKKVNIKNNRSKSLTTPSAHYGNSMGGFFLDKKQKVRGAVEINQDQEFFFYYLPSNTDEWKSLKLGKKDYNITLIPAGYSENPNEVYVLSNHEESVVGLYLFNLNTGNMKFIYRHEYVDAERVISDLNDNTVGVMINPGYREIVWLDKKNSYVKFRRSLEASFPGQSVGITSETDSGDKVVVIVSSDKNAGQFYLYDKVEGTLNYLASTFPNIKPKELSEMKPIVVTARDGTELHGYLTLPKGKDPKNLPLIVNPHGGPHGPRDFWRYNPEVQLLANRGYAVLQINFRGSGGYGMEFQETGYGKWGREMQDDVTDATLWAVDQGYADKERLCIYGGSYGGYAALQGVVREPDLYKCAVGYVGVYDLEQFKTCGDGAGQKARTKILAKYVGTDKTVQRAYSPAYNVDKIKADLFIAHGIDDVRVPMCQGNALKKALEKAGKDFIWMARDEGHGYQKMDNKRDFYSTMLTFIDKNIGH
jgi:dienelactone hydrolase